MSIIKKEIPEKIGTTEKTSALSFGNSIAKVFLGDFSGYFDALYTSHPTIYGDKHHPILDKVVSLIDKKLPVLDLGCGTGKDSLWLAKEGFKCINSVDISEKGLSILKSKIDDNIKDNITLYNSSIKDYLKADKNKYGLIFSSGSLQYDLNWESEILKFKNSTLIDGYNCIVIPLFDDISWNCIDKDKLLSLYKDRDIKLNDIRYKKGNMTKPRLHFIAQKK